MEPRQLSVETAPDVVGDARATWASMEPRQFSVETRLAQSQRPTAATLQWSHAQLSVETRRCCQYPEKRARRFNGATLN